MTQAASPLRLAGTLCSLLALAIATTAHAEGGRGGRGHGGQHSSRGGGHGGPPSYPPGDYRAYIPRGYSVPTYLPPPLPVYVPAPPIYVAPYAPMPYVPSTKEIIGVAIVAAIVTALTSSSRKSSRDATRAQPFAEDAIEDCIGAVESERSVKVDAVEGAKRDGDGLLISGVISDGRGFRCRVDSAGAVIATQVD